MTASQAALLAGAGVVGGLIGTAGGITSLVTYPALLAVGIPPLPANVTNLVAVVGCWPGSAIASQRELARRSRWLRQWLPLSCAGALVGSLLLLTTPSNVFTRVVPFLVLLGALALALQPWLLAWRHAATPEGNIAALAVGIGAISLYNGYFGAGSGVMTLALLLLTMEASLPTANALKNMLVGSAAVVSAALFAVASHVDWSAALPLGAGMFVGSLLGPRVTRRMPTGALRWIVAVLAVVLAAELWFRPTL